MQHSFPSQNADIVNVRINACCFLKYDIEFESGFVGWYYHGNSRLTESSFRLISIPLL